MAPCKDLCSMRICELGINLNRMIDWLDLKTTVFCNATEQLGVDWELFCPWVNKVQSLF